MGLKELGAFLVKTTLKWAHVKMLGQSQTVVTVVLWWWLQRCCVLQTGEQSASDIGDFCEVFDEMSSSQSTSAPPSVNLDCAKSDSEGSSKPYPAAPPSPALSLSNSKSTHSPSPSGSPLYAPKQKCPKLKISAQPANKVLNKESKRNLGQHCKQVWYWVTDV